jgi:heat shock protein HslJ
MFRNSVVWRWPMAVTLILSAVILAACSVTPEEEAEELEAPQAIPGTSWLVTAYDDGAGNMVDVLEGTEITAHFSRETPESGTLTGSAGCNEYESSYDVAGDYVGIGIELATTTQDVCTEPEGIMAQEQAYLVALGEARKWVLDGYQLEFTDYDGELVVRFTYTGPYEEGGDDELVVPPDGIDFTYTFDDDQESWIAGFSDLPADYEEEIYELDSEWRELPDDLDGHAIYMQGHNRSDDLFMFLKREVDGLEPGANYGATFRLVLASNVPAGLSGVGGSPGESVYVKVGAATIEPIVEEEADGWLRMNIDKGNQAREGEDMINIGDLANPNLTPETAGAYELMEQNSSGRDFEVTADENGVVWFIVGTDSGFEGLTTLYYDTISVVLEQKRSKS